MLATQEAVKSFGQKGGNIVNISSVASVSSSPGLSVYSATKGAVDALTRTLAKELGPRNIRINTINPGLVETEGTHTMGYIESEIRQIVEEKTPLGRIGQPQDIASAAVFLASDDASWITGESLFITGGYR
jgi:3-oxoacyl-[acyl-carrier protein] reductase